MKFEIENRSYAYDLIGEGPPLVLLHGFTGTKKTWDVFLPKWTKEYTVIRIDMPGHGNTVCTKFPNINEFCTDLASLLDYLNYPKVHILGYSMGGRVALQFSKKQQGRINSLILESSSPGLATKSERQGRMSYDSKLIKLLETEGLISFVNKWEKIPLFNSQRKLSFKLKQKIRKERLGQTVDGLVSSLKYMGTGAQSSVWESLIKLNFPILLLVGSLDEKFIKINNVMNKKLLYSQLEVISGAGHAIHVEKPAQFDTVVIEFLNRATLN